MLGLGINSLLAGSLQLKPYIHLQWLPHLTKHLQVWTRNIHFTHTDARSLCQWWRLITSQLAFTNSSDLFLAELVLYNVSVTLERVFGSSKFAV